jgi:MoaA/NifB/PqqE/SkfB family radical SAM enzyme
MIRIVNWLLTRRCNLSCDYCGIVKNYPDMPQEYPLMSHYVKNEMTTKQVIKGLEQFQLHNPDCFHIFYGGEPLLRKDLADIINHCNDNDIHYTIISNNTNQIIPLIDKLFDEVAYIQGFTASVDPSFNEKNRFDRIIKSISGFENLLRLKDRINDVVAEITVMRHNVNQLYTLVKLLTENGISSDITFVDIAKSPFYDFSNIADENLLVERSSELGDVFSSLQNSDLDIHMKDILLPKIWEILPSDLDCELEKDLHNVTVDADGTIRLCLRIRGTHAPKLVKVANLIDSKGNISFIAQKAIAKDKEVHCQGCNHTCLLMSKHINETDQGTEDLIHLDRRV